VSHKECGCAGAEAHKPTCFTATITFLFCSVRMNSDTVFVVSPDWSNESNNSVAALLMPDSNDKAPPEDAADGSAQPHAPGARPDIATPPDGGSEAPAVDPAQARCARHTFQMLCKRQDHLTRSGGDSVQDTRVMHAVDVSAVQSRRLSCYADRSTELVLACWHTAIDVHRR